MTAPATFAEAVAAVRDATPHDAGCAGVPHLTMEYGFQHLTTGACDCTKPQRENARIAKGIEAVRRSDESHALNAYRRVPGHPECACGKWDEEATTTSFDSFTAHRNAAALAAFVGTP